MTENMRIWDAVSKTDPKRTKEVSFGRKFTSVNANSQIMEATRQFGPIGVGWGYDTVGHELIGDFFMAKVTLWHGNRENKFGPMLGCAQMFNVGKNKTSDSDAPKKAATDGLTKGLSQLGFNADIFLGMWDDNKYVQQREQEEEQKPIDIAIERIEHCGSGQALQEFYISLFRSDQRTAEQARVIAAKDKRKGELANV